MSFSVPCRCASAAGKAWDLCLIRDAASKTASLPTQSPAPKMKPKSMWKSLPSLVTWDYVASKGSSTVEVWESSHQVVKVTVPNAKNIGDDLASPA